MRVLTIILLLIAYGSVYMFGYSDGAHKVKTNIIVRWYPLTEMRKYYGTCQTEVYFNGQRGVACAILKEND